ncbi:HAD family hydrolase [Propionibacterium australiense]|uniref:phosphoserine phosphatase n=1 Tax=Propionibacterium australiense TaxID=119981 RepID=A0A383S978_9ACTN|nr:haloacid dehalogenase-like hydrolase [Propionibacterium australiense]RLP10970.1 haloacid dehalogenase-like hydrolase [Propionibacterium australiense]RLP13063.1 haloacid dehalogenase-like hydrolase [Propionibacterium australiense]SYZ33929.1 HAD-like domain [Propionibacterium australiense]VEH90950.1 HAD phosphoserine phosphatase-like hydrolase, family IB [Propionibacterium australiense]
MKKSSLVLAAPLVLGALTLSACSAGQSNASESSATQQSSATSSCRVMDSSLDWFGDNLTRIDEMIAELGECGGSGEYADGAPVAFFDWDNTVVKNDIGDAQTFWMLANGKVRQPADRDWRTVSPWITDEAARVLSGACDALAEPGEPMDTASQDGAGCADEILSVYSEGVTTTGEEAFTGFNARRIEPQYAFAAQLLAGWTTEEVKEFATSAREQNLDAAEGATQVVGTTEVTGWVRYYDQVVDLIETLRANGFDVRIISASAEPVAEVWGEALGFGAGKVMGVVTSSADSEKLTTTLASCGGDEASMPYIEGKRCRVNEEVFGIDSSEAFEVADEPARAAFAAGDSDTDVSFMSDATGLRLAINRNKTELMCQAYFNADGKWIVNPMFIDPKGQQAEPYPCSTQGMILPDGGTGPLTGEDGQAVPDQEDTVFAG